MHEIIQGRQLLPAGRSPGCPEYHGHDIPPCAQELKLVLVKIREDEIGGGIAGSEFVDNRRPGSFYRGVIFRVLLQHQKQGTTANKQ